MLLINLKPEIARLLAIPTMQRPAKWMEQLAVATFDLKRIEDVTPQQRNAAKRLYFAYAYSATPDTLMSLYREEAK